MEGETGAVVAGQTCNGRWQEAVGRNSVNGGCCRCGWRVRSCRTVGDCRW